jgi:hypothetical protein
VVTGTVEAEAEATDGEEEEEAIVMLPRVMAPAATVQVAAATVAAGGVSVLNLPVTGANSFSLCLSPYLSLVSDFLVIEAICVSRVSARQYVHVR